MEKAEIDELIPKMEEPFRSVLLFGPPGSGKGTQGRFLSSAGNHYHLSSGDIFRGLSPESPAGKLFHRYAGEGKLLPDEVTVMIWHHYVQGLIATNSYFPHEQLLLLDGVPRTLRQAELLAPHLDIVGIISLEMPSIEGLVARLKRRALIEGRHDDVDEQVVHNRMQVYQNETVKLLDFYPKVKIFSFNADQPPLGVLRDILGKLSQLL
ncbi:MAG: adenylate kinase [Chlamydiae bacterium]|nr:adenylate kinase [Chlamydiota bacterium]